jgi:hypothetical protein
MNKTRKLRGGDVLTQIERARLASIKSNTISGKVRDMLDYLKALTQSGKKEFDSEVNKKLTTLINSSYTEYIDIFKDLYQVTDPIQIKTAKELLLLQKHFNNVKVLVQTLLTSINQAKKLENKEAELTRIKGQTQTSPEEPIPQVAPQEVETGNPRIIDNLLAEIDILKSEIFSKDIMIEEQNKELVTAFYLLSNNENDNALSIMSSSSVNSGSSKPDDVEIAALRKKSEEQEADIARQTAEIARQSEIIAKQTAEQAELEQLRQTIKEQKETIERYEERIRNEAGDRAIQEGNIATNKRRIDELERIVGGNEGEIIKLKEELANIRQENDVIRATLGERDTTIAGLQAQLAAPVLPPINPNEALIKQLQQNNGELLAQKQALDLQLKGQTDNNARIVADLDTARQLNARITGELEAATKKTASLEKELGDEKGRNTALVTELAAANRTITKLEGDLAASKISIADLETRLGVATDSIDKLQGDLGIATIRIQNLEGEIKDLKAVSVATDATIPNLEQRISELTAIKTKLEKDLREQIENVRQINLQLSQATNYIAELRAEVDEPFNEASLNSTLSAKPKEIDHALILRHTLFNDLKSLIENIKKTTKYDIKTIITSLNDIIASCNDLYKSRIPLLTEPSTITQINQKIKEISTIIKK